MYHYRADPITFRGALGVMITVRNEELRALGCGLGSVWNSSTKREMQEFGELAGRHCTDSWSRLGFALAGVTKAPLLLPHKPCSVCFPRKKNACASLLKPASLRKSTGWPLSWRNETMSCWEERGQSVLPAHACSVCQDEEQHDTSCRELPFNHGTRARWRSSSEWDLYTGTQNQPLIMD